MAVTVTHAAGSPLNYYDATLENASVDTLLRKALAGSEAAGRKLAGMPQFEVNFATSDDTTAAQTTSLLNLSDAGVTFPADTSRKIRIVTFSGDGTVVGSTENYYHIRGGTTPVVTTGAQGAAVADNQAGAEVIALVQASNKIELRATGQDSDVVTWRVKIYVDDAVGFALV